jgi:CDP-diglyceride synthetase
MCGCLFAMGAAFFPRIAFIVLWILTPLVSRAFTGIILPVLGVILLPYTTLFYVLVYSPETELSIWAILFVIVGFLFDLGSYAGGGWFGRRRRR